MANKKELQKATHDLSHDIKTTYPMGYAVPTFMRLMSPGEDIHVKVLDNFRLDPFAFPIMDSVSATSTFYFVPLHQLYTQFEDFLRQAIRDSSSATMDNVRKNMINSIPWVPYGWDIDPDDVHTPPFNDDDLSLFKNLYDTDLGLFPQMGVHIPSAINVADPYTPFRPTGVSNLASLKRLSALPFLAYQKIMDDWFCDEEMEYKSATWPLDYLRDTSQNFTYADATGGKTTSPISIHNMINPVYWSSVRGERSDYISPQGNPVAKSPDNGFFLRRANWNSDLLTTRRPNPQIGVDEAVDVHPPRNPNPIKTGEILIDEFRESEAIQNAKMQQQNTGQFFSDFYKKFYGVEISDAMFGKCLSIGGDTMGLDISDVLQTSQTTADSPQANPVGYSRTVGESGGISHKANCFGILMRITRVLPRTAYHYGLDPIFTLTSPYDYFNPKLRGIGWQPIERSVVLPITMIGGASGEVNRVLSSQDMGDVSGWQPAHEYYRRQLSTVRGHFNITSGDRAVSGWTFARDYTGADLQQWRGTISARYRKADPTNRPFTVLDESGTQVQHYAGYRVTSTSLIPHAINNRDTLH
ncbi:major capsid protein [Blackfly microvirus SF02]|uniref:Major capsid protein n=1 Tax=Blackfly microvirus SF02 TaxID=2576452 RepID=A0A4P8PJW5_9VIRU|nr:major capsid protein [Blackfly microvirus SF02]